jgi:hypothetical protein
VIFVPLKNYARQSASFRIHDIIGARGDVPIVSVDGSDRDPTGQAGIREIRVGIRASVRRSWGRRFLELTRAFDYHGKAATWQLGRMRGQTA